MSEEKITMPPSATGSSRQFPIWLVILAIVLPLLIVALIVFVLVTLNPSSKIEQAKEQQQRQQ